MDVLKTRRVYDGHVVNPVWELYRLAHELTGGVSTLLEWDAKIPPFPVLHAEVLKAKLHIGEDLADPMMTSSTPQPAIPVDEETADFSEYDSAVPHPLHHIGAVVE